MVYKNAALMRRCTRYPCSTVQNSRLLTRASHGDFSLRAAFHVSKQYAFQKRALKVAPPSRAKRGHRGRATAKVKVSRGCFLGRFFAPSKTPPKRAVLTPAAFYSFSTSGAPTGTIFLGRPAAFGKADMALYFFLDPAPCSLSYYFFYSTTDCGAGAVQ
jgi:hypothetical protein